ncbi:MAG: RNA 2',3'-cyclic phosphodiesterase [Candidatus Diapherotrites archaeon]|nr:RNA 2',3'-cyclic phosphodiesterase [Candidatus Diapherotrites archaeon]
MRVFIAVNIPENVKEELWQKFSGKLRRKGIKVVERENLHITLLFLGEVPENYGEMIKAKLMPLREFGKFELSFGEIGYFEPRVLWIGFSCGEEKLKALHKEICYLLGLVEERFSAHLTIARNKNLNARDFWNLVEECRKERICASFVVSSIDIMKSTLTKAGPIYEKIGEVRFNA